VSAGSLAGLSILLVDDDRDNTELLAFLLQTAGAKVRTAASAPQALEMVADTASPWLPDVLLLDIGLPGVDGYDLLGMLRQQPALSAVPAVAVTAYAFEKDKQRAIDAGFRVHISKPYDAAEIVDVLAGLFATKRP
jgi:two-component system CheB/CheR fusion protein